MTYMMYCVTIAQNIVSHESSVLALVARILMRAPLCGLTGPGVELSSGTCKGGATGTASKAPSKPSQEARGANILENKDAKPLCGQAYIPHYTRTMDCCLLTELTAQWGERVISGS